MNQCTRCRHGAEVEPFVALPPSSDASRLSTPHWVPACARYDGDRALDQARWHLIRSSIPAKAGIRSAPGYERTCAAGTGAWSSRLWPCHRERASETHAALGFRPAPVRRNETLAVILRCQRSSTADGWTAAVLRLLRQAAARCRWLSASRCPHQRRQRESPPTASPHLTPSSSGEGGNPDRRLTLNRYMRCGQRLQRPSRLCGLATVEPMHPEARTPALVRPSPVPTEIETWRLSSAACSARTTGWTGTGAPVTPLRRAGTTGWLTSAFRICAQERLGKPEARPRISPARHCLRPRGQRIGAWI